MNPNFIGQESSEIDPFFENNQPKAKKSFDFVLWFYRIIKYWYLFIISLLLFLGYAYLKNKSWIPNYQTSAVLMMESRGSSGIAMGSVPLGNVLGNTINQQMILQSYDMITRTVDRLPQMKVDYFIRDKFKVNNLYGQTAVSIDCQYVAADAYSLVYSITPVDAERCKIHYDATPSKPAFSMIIPYGQYIQEPEFYIKVNKADSANFNPNWAPFNFRFVTKAEIINRYAGRVSSSLIKEGSTALNISVSGSNALQDRDFLNALLTEFQASNLALKNEAAERYMHFIDKQLGIIRDSLEISETMFNDYQHKSGIYTLGTSDANKETIAQSTKQLANLKIQETNLLAASDQINNAITQNKELVDPENYGYTNSNLSKYITTYNDKLDRLQAMGKNHPFYQQAAQGLRSMSINILEELKKEQGKMQAEENGIQSNKKDVNAVIDSLPEKERKFAILQRHYQVNESYVTFLTERKREASLQEASNIPDNYVLETPRSSGAINAGETSKRYSFFFLLALSIPVLFIVCKEELLNFSITTKDECEKISGLPVIGTIENVERKRKLENKNECTLVKNFPKSSFAESFRNMRIRIEYMAQKESSIAVLVTSAEPGDGKTFVAANIASVYQLTGKKVILVDFDLRRPSVSNLLNINSKGGISNYLIGQLKLDDIITTHPEYGFDVLPAGTLPPNPSELIKTIKTKDLIAYLRSEYDYVIIDCSPVGLVSDALILSKYVDTSLFVVRRAKTNRAFFKSVVVQMCYDGLKHAAIVFNDVKGREGYYGTSRYYGDRTYYLKHNSYYHDDYFEK